MKIKQSQDTPLRRTDIAKYTVRHEQSKANEINGTNIFFKFHTQIVLNRENQIYVRWSKEIQSKCKCYSQSRKPNKRSKKYAKL